MFILHFYFFHISKHFPKVITPLKWSCPCGRNLFGVGNRVGATFTDRFSGVVLRALSRFLLAGYGFSFYLYSSHYPTYCTTQFVLCLICAPIIHLSRGPFRISTPISILSVNFVRLLVWEAALQVLGFKYITTRCNFDCVLAVLCSHALRMGSGCVKAQTLRLSLDEAW